MKNPTCLPFFDRSIQRTWTFWAGRRNRAPLCTSRWSFMVTKLPSVKVLKKQLHFQLMLLELLYHPNLRALSSFLTIKTIGNKTPFKQENDIFFMFSCLHECDHQSVSVLEDLKQIPKRNVRPRISSGMTGGWANVKTGGPSTSFNGQMAADKHSLPGIWWM